MEHPILPAATGAGPDLGLYRVLRDDATADPAHDPQLSPADLLRLFKQMLLIRTLDDRCLKLQRQGRIAFYGTSTGQEAATVGSAFCLRPEDWCFPALREGGAALMRGMPVSRYIAQLMGNAHDEEKGHQQPMHFSWRAANHVSLSSPIGTQLPQGVGAARAIQIAKKAEVVLAYIGDGGTSEPDFHVALTFAGVWKAPVVIFCQNNGWAISVPTKIQCSAPTIAQRGLAYGMDCVQVDGNDIFAVVKVVRDAAVRARENNRPTFIEATTYRLGDHTTADDARRYRDSDEVDAWKNRDPLIRLRTYLDAKGLWDDAREEQLADSNKQKIIAVVKRAEEISAPTTASFFDAVYADINPDLARQRDAMRTSSLGLDPSQLPSHDMSSAT